MTPCPPPGIFAYRSSPGHGCVSQTPRCHSDPRTSTGRCCCDTGVTCSNPPHRRTEGTALHVEKTHGRTQWTTANTLVVSPLCVSLCLCVWLCLSHQAVSSPLAFCWYWTALLYKGNLQRRDKGLRWQTAQVCFSGLNLWELCLLCVLFFSFVVAFVILLLLLLYVRLTHLWILFLYAKKLIFIQGLIQWRFNAVHCTVLCRIYCFLETTVMFSVHAEGGYSILIDWKVSFVCRS